MFYVYLIKNIINGKLYVGKTSNIGRRWNDHKRIALGGKEKYPKHYQVLHQAIAKYGVKNFTITAVGGYEAEQEAFNKEIGHIAELKNENYILYNLTDGGEGMSGHKLSETSKRKMSLSKIGKKATEEAKYNMRLAKSGKNHPNYGKSLSDETRKKISIAGKNKHFSESHRKNISIANSGRVVSKETKEKMSIIMTGNTNCLGKLHSIESKLKQSISQSGEGNNATKLTWKKVNKIRALRAQGFKLKKIASKFNVCIDTISSICNNKTWKA